MSVNVQQYLQNLLSQSTPSSDDLPLCEQPVIICPEYIPYVPTNIVYPTSSSSSDASSSPKGDTTFSTLLPTATTDTPNVCFQYPFAEPLSITSFPQSIPIPLSHLTNSAAKLDHSPDGSTPTPLNSSFPAPLNSSFPSNIEFEDYPLSTPDPEPPVFMPPELHIPTPDLHTATPSAPQQSPTTSSPQNTTSNLPQNTTSNPPRNTTSNPPQNTTSNPPQKTTSSFGKVAKPRGRPSNLTPTQRATLETEFNSSHFIHGERKIELSKKLKLSPNRIGVWFRSRRAALKKSGKAERGAKRKEPRNRFGILEEELENLLKNIEMRG